MDEEQKARFYLKAMHEAWPKNFVEKIDVKSRGLWIILHYISVSTGEVCAGDISKEFNVSTARTTVVLKTLTKKGFIETYSSADDRRRVVVKITEKGKSALKKAEDELVEFMKLLIDKVGEDDIKEFVRIFAKINQLNICNNYHSDCIQGGYHVRT
ncbi:MAG: winged helix-turn-helix transcriptional regulator [Clostridiales bacterium]|nr:winged helix-turn-helix transcriptional regulator [Clostridiales bacterium]